jgi:Raf kinase inhibitor-like YbhB/YbcL family protein
MPEKSLYPLALEVIVLGGLTLGLLAFTGPPYATTAERPGDLTRRGAPPMNLQVTSSAFRDGQAVPKQFTADGKNVSPPLQWGDPPDGTKSFALIAEDPDAPRGTWTHWVLFNLPADKRSLEEGVPAEGTLPGGARQGSNDFGKLGYGGPSPPAGKPHRYYFKLYALDAELNLPPGATKKQVLAATEGHVLAEGQLMGTYGRPGR